MNLDSWIQTASKCQILPQTAIKKLCRRVKTLLFQQSNVQPVQAPVTICGDVHGQFFDVLQIFKKGKSPPGTKYIFIGDFVDRGYHSVETITLLFCLKAKYPDSVTLLRGNHQSRNITYMYGFYEQISHKYGNYNVWYLFNEVFDYLPLGAIIEGKIFCVHGGLSPKMNTIDHIRSIERNIEIPTTGPLCDLMWSDPEEVDTWAQNPRGAGWLFGERVSEEFIKINALSVIVRAHQLVKQGYRKQFNNKVITVWSAPNYCYRMNNQAAIMQVNQALEFNFIQYEASPLSHDSQDYKKLIPYFL